MILDLDNQTELTVDIDALEKIAQDLTTQEIEVIIVDNDQIQELNREYRGKDAPTDVISFPMETLFTEQPIFEVPLGSIVISADYVKQKAKEHGHSQQDELTLLFIHGLLHLLGFDHESDTGEMRAKEAEIIKKWKLPSSLIVRTEES